MKGILLIGICILLLVQFMGASLTDDLVVYYSFDDNYASDGRVYYDVSEWYSYLTQDEIREIYNEGLGVPYPFSVVGNKIIPKGWSCVESVCYQVVESEPEYNWTCTYKICYAISKEEKEKVR